MRIFFESGEHQPEKEQRKASQKEQMFTERDDFHCGSCGGLLCTRCGSCHNCGSSICSR